VSNDALSLSDAGFTAIKGEEATINGLYDDPSEYCTYGVGHSVYKDKSLLLSATAGDKTWSSYVETKWAGTSNATHYLDRSVAIAKNFQDFVKEDLKPFERTTRSAIAGTDPTQAEFDALISFAFNISSPGSPVRRLRRKHAGALRPFGRPVRWGLSTGRRRRTLLVSAHLATDDCGGRPD
jgi:GH24 family phage-related lysozyme (muramidase)